MITAGIDPGKTGALVVLFEDSSASVHRVPLMKLRGKEQPMWGEWEASWSSALDFACPDLLVIEDISARPGQGVTSMFNFGKTLGFVLAIAQRQRKPLYLVTPSTWKGKFGLLKSDKNASRETAGRLIPSLGSEIARVKDDGVAEAALMALYGRKFLSA